jgi:mono/diheme cytochrome c family protein
MPLKIPTAFAAAVGFCLMALPVQAASVPRGLALAQRNCAQCHAVEETGASSESAAPPFRSLNRYVSMDALAQALRQGLLRKHPAMPEFRFTPAEVEDVVAYLRSIQDQV